jgi:hypothetical protein
LKRVGSLAKPMSLMNFVSSNSSKDGAGFAETARLIAGENPPQWLVHHLQRWSSSVMLDGSVRAKLFGKAEARARLKELGKAIDRIDREVRDPVILELLLADAMGSLPTTASTDAVLREICRRADIASSPISLLGTGIDERLEELSDVAKLVTRELQDPELSEFLRAEQRAPPPENTEFGTALKEIGRQAESALSSVYLATKAGKAKTGASRALLPAASSPRSFCAAVILEAWAHFHDGHYPAASNIKLAAAAEEYWHRCGGTTNPWSDRSDKTKTLGAWKPYFKEASEPSSETIRKELRRHLLISAADNR